MKWSFEFIRKHQDKLILNILINNIPSVIVADNLAFFIQWATEKELLGLMSKYVSTQFVFEQIVLNRILLISHNIKINWELVLGVAPLKSLNDIAFLNEDELLELPSADALRTYLSSKCEIDFILNNSDLFWDWEHLTSQRIDTDKFKNDKFVIDYSKYLFWPFVIKEHYTVEELTQEEKLNPLAILLQNASETVRVKAWNEITRKIPFNNLISVIEKYNNEIQFQWDWDYISSSKFIPINRRFLSMYSDKINWKFLSNNSTLSSFFQFSKVVYQGVQQWLDRTLEYLHAYKEKWDFTSLSTVNNITWNEQIIYEFEEAWDWQILSALSPLLTNLNKETKIIEYDKSRLNRFARLLDWGVLSNRFEVTLSPKLVGKYCNQPWDWGKLSSHPRFTLTKDFILENCSKPWDFHALSSHRHLKIDKDFLLQLKEENWDFNLISKEGWIDNDLLLTFSDRKWNWALLSSNTNLIFDINLLEQFVLQDDSNWNKILLSDSLHITPGTLQLLESNNIVNSDHWDSLSIHQNLDFQQHPQLLTAYKKKWNWGGLIKCWKPDFNDLTILSDYEDYINWNLLCNSEKFSPSQEVLLKFKQLLNWKVLSKRIVFDINSLRLFKDYLDWEYISKDQSINFTTEMIEEFKSFWDYYYLRENIAVSISSRNKVFEIIDSIPELKFYFKLKEQNSHWAGYIYHFTLLDNAINILRVKKILSRTKAAKIGFYDSASPQVVSSNNVPHKYTRFYLRPQTPYQYYSQDMGKDKNSKENTFNHFVSLGRPKCPITVIFKFNLQEIILKKKYGQEFEITNGNAHRRGVKRGLISDVYKYFNYQDVFSTIDDTTDNKWRTYKDCSQQEFLIENEFDFSDINDFNVIVQSESDRVQLLSQMESEFEFVNNRVIIDKSQKYLHKLNPKLRYEYYESILSVDLLYTFEYENHFNFILEFEKPEKYQVNGGNILNLTDTKITFKSKININIDQNIKFKILLVDNLKKEICPIFSNSEEQSKVSSRFITIGQNLTELELV